MTKADDLNFKVDSDSISEIRSRSYEDDLDSKLEEVWLVKAYSKTSVKEYVTHLLKELDYQKDSFKLQLKDLMDEKDRLISEKNVLAKQLEDTINKKGDISNFNVNELITKIETLEKSLQIEKDKNNELVLNSSNEEVVSTLIEEKEMLMQQLELITNELNDFKNNAEKQETTIDVEALNIENEKLIDEFESVYNENSELNAKLSVLEQDKTDLISEIKKISTEYDELKKIISQTEDVTAIKEENTMLQTELLSLSRAIQNLSVKTSNQTNKINELSVELENERVKNSEVINERAQLQIRLTAYLEHISEFKDKIEYLQASNTVLLKQLEEQRQKNRVLTGMDLNADLSKKVFTQIIGEEDK